MTNDYIYSLTTSPCIHASLCSVWWNDKNLGDTSSVPALREHDGGGSEGDGSEGDRRANHSSSGSNKGGGEDETTTNTTTNHLNSSGKASEQWQDVGGGESSIDPLQDPDFLSPTLPVSRFAWSSRDGNRFTVRLPDKGQLALVSTLTLALWDTGEEHEEGQGQGQGRGQGQGGGLGEGFGFAAGSWGGAGGGGGGDTTPGPRSATPTSRRPRTAAAALYSGCVRLPFSSLLHIRDGVVTLPFLPPGADPFLATRTQVPPLPSPSVYICPT